MLGLTVVLMDWRGLRRIPLPHKQGSLSLQSDLVQMTRTEAGGVELLAQSWTDPGEYYFILKMKSRAARWFKNDSCGCEKQ